MKKNNDKVKRQRNWDDDLIDDSEFLKKSKINKCRNPECDNLVENKKFCSDACRERKAV